MKLLLLNFLIVHPFSLCLYESTIVSQPDELSMLANLQNGTYNKPILRYGFHRTSECHDFDKAYICIQKCLDFHYDIAYADKNCYCTCYSKKDKAKYSEKATGKEQKWKLGAPTTKIPAWADKKTTEKQQNTHESGDNINVEDLVGNQTDTIESNNTVLINKGNANGTEAGTEAIDVNIVGNTTDLVNSTTASPIAEDTNTNATVTGNSTAPQNSTA